MRDQRSAEAEAYRRLYRTARWQRTRADQLARQPLCEVCSTPQQPVAATVCNHVDKDSKATVEGFFAGPFSSVCAPCHDSVIQKQERRGHIIGSDEAGMPRDPTHHWNR